MSLLRGVWKKKTNLFGQCCVYTSLSTRPQPLSESFLFSCVCPLHSVPLEYGVSNSDEISCFPNRRVRSKIRPSLRHFTSPVVEVKCVLLYFRIFPLQWTVSMLFRRSIDRLGMFRGHVRRRRFRVSRQWTDEEGNETEILTPCLEYTFSDIMDLSCHVIFSVMS